MPRAEVPPDAHAVSDGRGHRFAAYPRCQAGTTAIVMQRERRNLTEIERFVLREVQSYWGDQNTIDEVFFTDNDEAALFVKARDGSHPVCVVLTLLGTWHRDGLLSIEELRRQIMGPDAGPHVEKRGA